MAASDVTIDATWLAAHGAPPYVLDQAGTRYVLAQDVTANGTAFAIQADHVTFDLGGHTVIYGNGPAITVPNGSFEAGTSGWDFSAAPNATVQIGTFVEPVQVSDGNHSMVISLPSTNQTVRSAQSIHLPGGRYYVLSARYFNMMNNNTSSTLTLSLVDATSGATLASASMQGTTWRGFQYFNAFYHPSAEADVKIAIAYTGGSPGGTVYLDDVRIGIGPSYGVVESAAWAPGVYDNPAGGAGDNAVITNGTINQGAGGGFASHAIYFNQGPGNNSEVSHIASTVSGVNAVNIRADYHGGMIIHDNILTSRVTVIESRDQQQGALIDIGNDSTALGADQIYANTLVGGAQCGIIVEGGPGIAIYNNDISQNAYYTNDFAVMVNAAGVVVHDNYIHPTCGRGIHVIASGVQVYNNRMVMQELNQNQEYNGTQALGTYGVQLEDSANGALVHDNDITVNGGACGGVCLRATDIAAGSANIVSHNTFTANGNHGHFQTVDVSLAVHGDGALTLLNNTMTADEVNITTPYDGSIGALFQGNTISKGSNAGTGYHTVWYESSGAATGLVLLDDVFTDGADPTDARMVPIGYGGWGGAEDYAIAWTLDLSVVDMAGHALPGASVSIADAHGQTVFTGTTDAQGQVHPPLTQCHRYNTTSQATNIDTATPHQITVSMNGASVTGSVTMLTRTALTLQLATTAGGSGSTTGAGTGSAGGTGATAGGGHSCGMGGGFAMISAWFVLRRRRARTAERRATA